jgi:hypothetical protein
LDSEPIETAAQVASVIQGDLEALHAGEHLRVGTRVLNGVAARSLIMSLLTSVDHVEVAALARQYISTATIEKDGEGLHGINVDN